MASEKSDKVIKISDIIIKKYHKIFNDKEHEHIILTSGRAGTKSSYAGIKEIYTIISPSPAAVVVMRKHHNKLRKTVYKETLRAITRLGLSKDDFKITKSPMQITYKKTGNTIYFTGSDSVDDTKGIIDEDRPIKLVVLDELTEFFDDGDGEDELSNIEATFVRGNDDEFQMLYLYNPPKNPNAPIVEWCRKMEQRSDTVHIHSTYQDVPISWVGKKLVQSAEQMKAIDEKLYNWVWGGESTGIDELIYYMFNDSHIAKTEPMGRYTIGIGIDYGQQNATTYQAFGIDYEHKRLHGLGEYYHSGRESGKQRAPSEYAKDFKDFYTKMVQQHGTGDVYVFIDPSARGLAEEIKRVCPQVKIRDADNTVKTGIARHQKLLTYGIMDISPSQENLKREYGLYEYDPKSIDRGDEVPLKINDHCQDATRYCIMGLWSKIKSFLPESEREEAA